MRVLSGAALAEEGSGGCVIHAKGKKLIETAHKKIHVVEFVERIIKTVVIIVFPM